jgi:hypothetical protein
VNQYGGAWYAREQTSELKVFAGVKRGETYDRHIQKKVGIYVQVGTGLNRRHLPAPVVKKTGNDEHLISQPCKICIRKEGRKLMEEQNRVSEADFAGQVKTRFQFNRATL